MKTDIKTFAALIATQVWCNGEYSEVEIETTEEIAEAFELPLEEFKEAVGAEIARIEKLNDEEITAFLAENAAKVAKEESGELYEALMQMALCDGVLTSNEVNNLLAVADALGMGTESAVLLLCDLVKSEPELEISFED